MFTCATPLTIDSRCATVVWAYSSTLYIGSVSDVSDNSTMGESAGLTLRKDGGFGISAGRRGCARENSHRKTRAAPPLSRSSEKSRVIEGTQKPPTELLPPTAAAAGDRFFM